MSCDFVQICNFIEFRDESDLLVELEALPPVSQSVAEWLAPGSLNGTAHPRCRAKVFGRTPFQGIRDRGEEMCL